MVCKTNDTPNAPMVMAKAAVPAFEFDGRILLTPP
jgi:hypothetical protein